MDLSEAFEDPECNVPAWSPFSSGLATITAAASYREFWSMHYSFRML